jgi:membrane-bound lytic murein transglycosylase D
MSRFVISLLFSAFACPLTGIADPGTDSGSATSYSNPGATESGDAPPDAIDQDWAYVVLVGQSVSRAMQRYADMAPDRNPSFYDNATDESVDVDNPGPVMPSASIWTRIRNGLALPQVESRRVAQFESWYRKHPEYFERMIERSSLFLHFIVEEIEKRGMPTEIALLPMIESGYNPNAYSRAHASGIWQFIPSTGKNYGLEQNWWHDDRRDVIAATGAALDYLGTLHDEFQDWQLALAAYNWGENGVRRAIARNKKSGKPTSYYSLRMPRETRNYLPKLQAVTNIIKDPVKVGLILPEVPDRPYFTTIETEEHIDVELVARLAEMSVEEFETLNAAYNRPVIASDGERKIILPLEKAKIFTTNLEYHNEPLVSWQTYALQENETVDQVAARFNIDANKLRQINGVKPYVTLRTGHSLLVPMPASADASNLDETWDRPEFRRPNDFYGTRIVHRIKPGDTLSTIAQRYGVSMRGIKSWNHLSGSFIRAGQKLVIYRDLRVPRVSKMLQ